MRKLRLLAKGDFCVCCKKRILGFSPGVAYCIGEDCGFKSKLDKDKPSRDTLTTDYEQINLKLMYIIYKVR